MELVYLWDEKYKNIKEQDFNFSTRVVCNYLHKDDINKRNHSKLTQDILKQFDLVKEK